MNPVTAAQGTRCKGRGKGVGRRGKERLELMQHVPHAEQAKHAARTVDVSLHNADRDSIGRTGEHHLRGQTHLLRVFVEVHEVVGAQHPLAEGTGEAGRG